MCSLIIRAAVVLLLPSSAPAETQIYESDIAAALRVADELEDAASYEEFRVQVRAVADLVGSPRGDSLRLRACASLQHQRRWHAATACFAALAQRCLDSEVRALARYREASLLGRQGPTQAARDALEQLVLEARDTDGARRATRVLRGWRREEMGRSAEADWLIGIASQLRVIGGGQSGALRAEVLVEAGRIRLADLGQVRGAALTLQRADKAARETRWRDDAWIWRARALARMGRPVQALPLLEALIALRDSSWGVGSYDSPHLDDALFERGQLLVELGRRDAGLSAFDALADQVPHSRLLDDAAFAAARLRWQAGQGDALSLFIGAHPESRLAADAQRLMGEAQ